MPYIKQENRDKVDKLIDQLISALQKQEKKKGALNYAITRIAAGTFLEGDVQPKDWSYDNIADVIGAFECAKLEFYRRVAEPKEDKAKLDNGDVWEYDPWGFSKHVGHSVGD